jgi:hypothetical protein
MNYYRNKICYVNEMRGWLEKFLECYTSNYRERDKHEEKKKKYFFSTCKIFLFFSVIWNVIFTFIIYLFLSELMR